MPAIPGVEDFRGEAYHTAAWPHQPVSFAGKRVAVIGTGATGVQAITEIAKTVGHLTVFQRTPNWCAPLHNSPIDAETQRAIKARYPEIFETCRESFGCFIHQHDPRNALEVSPEVREAFYEQRYREPGFGIWMGNFRDILIDKTANDTITAFMRRKIRERVQRPEAGRRAHPDQPRLRHPPRAAGERLLRGVQPAQRARWSTCARRRSSGSRRPASARATPSTTFDMIVYATGFDAITGAFDRIDIRGVGGQRLRDKWAGGPRTYLGLQIAGFPEPVHAGRPAQRRVPSATSRAASSRTWSG